MRIKLKFAAVAFIAVILFTANAFAADNTEVYFNGEKQPFTVTVYTIDDIQMIPMRPIFELFNYKVDWNNKHRTITTSTVLGKMRLGIGSVFVCLNDYQAYVLKTYPRIYNGNTMVPLEFAAECTEAAIQYNESNNSLVITSK